MKIAKGGLEIHVSLVPIPTETGGYLVPSLSELEVRLREQGVLASLNIASVKAAIDKASLGLTADAVAAAGKPPVKGKDGYVELLVEFGNALPPVLQGGNVDLRATNLIRNVEPGQPLAMIHLPSEGQAGYDVFGKTLPAEPGKLIEPKLGSNTIRSPHDRNLIVAETGGHVRLVDGVLEVQEVYVVEGDVDYASGNIGFGKSVLIRGDVKGGFAVEAGGDIEVTGLVEDCSVKSHGKVFVQGGFTGKGEGVIQARGDISLGYVRNQLARSEKTILVLKEAVNARLQARQAVSVNGLLAGGKIQARFAIECQVAGNETGATTHLEAGYDYTIAEEMLEIRQEMDKMGKFAKKLEDGLRQIHDVEKLNRNLERWAIELMFEMEESRAKVDAKIRQLRERFSELERAAAEAEKATITVHRQTYPGVVIKIGKEVFHVDKPLAGSKTFYNQDGLIKFR